VEVNNSNEYARLSLNYNLDDLKEVDVKENIFIKNSDIKMKLSKLGVVNLLDNVMVKDMIKKLLEQDLRLSSILETEIPLNLQIFDKGEWKESKMINPGDLAKTYMKYYFKKVIGDEQPDVIFIDQPENDVDKTFITDTLSDFIKNTKATTQFIITTHDPILAINSDANLIILAELSEKNQIMYKSFALEDFDDNTLENIGTNIVSKILDGGKMNVRLRYQMYGGN
jgi:hypothetical protein